MLGCLLSLNSSCCICHQLLETKQVCPHLVQIDGNLGYNTCVGRMGRVQTKYTMQFFVLNSLAVKCLFYTRQRLLLLHARRRKIGKVATTMSTQIFQVKRLPRVPIESIESGQKAAPRRVDTESNPPPLVTGLKDPSTQSHRSSQAQWIALDHANLFSPLILSLFTFFVPGIRELVMAVFCFVVGINALAMLVMIVDVGII